MLLQRLICGGTIPAFTPQSHFGWHFTQGRSMNAAADPALLSLVPPQPCYRPNPVLMAQGVLFQCGPCPKGARGAPLAEIAAPSSRWLPAVLAALPAPLRTSGFCSLGRSALRIPPAPCAGFVGDGQTCTWTDPVRARPHSLHPSAHRSLTIYTPFLAAHPAHGTPALARVTRSARRPTAAAIATDSASLLSARPRQRATGA